MNISDKELQGHIDQLPKEMTPERDLWQGIEKAINQSAIEQAVTEKPMAKVFVPTAWAASVVAAVLLTWVGIGTDSTLDNSPSLIAALNQDFSQQKQLMLTSFGTPDLTKLSPEMKKELDNLATARASIAKALADDENNTDLINLLQWTQQQELDLLKKLYAPQWQTI